MSKANTGACPRRARKRMGTRIVRIWRITQRWSYAFLLSCLPLHDLPGTVPNLRRRVAADIFRQGGLRNSWDSPLQCHPAPPVSFPPLQCHSRGSGNPLLQQKQRKRLSRGRTRTLSPTAIGGHKGKADPRRQPCLSAVSYRARRAVPLRAEWVCGLILFRVIRAIRVPSFSLSSS